MSASVSSHIVHYHTMKRARAEEGQSEGEGLHLFLKALSPVAQASLELGNFLPPPPKYWDHRPGLPYPARGH